MADTVTLVQSTWAMVEADKPAVAKLFYSNLFEIAPTLPTTLFKGLDMQVQGGKLMAMIGGAVGKLSKPDELLPALRSLGARHVGYGTADAHYPIVGQALLKTLKQGLGDAFTPDVEKAWTEVYGTMVKYMLEGAASPDGVAAGKRYAERMAARAETSNPMELVQSTWAIVEADKPAVAKLFYSNLFEIAPTLPNTLFKGLDMQVQGGKLMSMIGGAVGKLSKPDELLPALRSLGARHVGYGTADAHYPIVGQALLKTLKQGLGNAFTPDVEKAWTEVYGTMVKYMLEGAASPDGVAAGKRYAERMAKQNA